MPVVNMLEAKSNLSRLVETVESGAESEIIITRIGIATGRFTVPDNIDADNKAIEKLFGGNAE